MKKLLTLSLVLALALVLNNVSFAQDAAAPQQDSAAPLSVENVDNGQVVYENAQDFNGQAAGCNSCGESMNDGFAPCGPRRACSPCYANACNPCPPRNCGLFGRRAGCAPVANCAAPCGDYNACGTGYSTGYNACGTGCSTGYSACGPCGYGQYRTPVRNLLVRLFAPRPYCGYDAYYGPQGDCNSGCYAPCNGSFSSGCSSCY